MINLLKMIIYRTINNKIFLLLVLFVPAIVVIGSIIYTNNIEFNIRLRSNWRKSPGNQICIMYNFRRTTKAFRTHRGKV